MKRTLSGIMILMLSQYLSGQSAWTLSENSWYTQLSFTKIGPYSELFVNGSETSETPREIDDSTLQLYTEYGLNGKTTLSLGIPVKFIKTGDATIANPDITASNVTSLGNIGFGIKRKLSGNNIIISAGLAIEANTGSYEEESGIRTGYDAWTITPAVFIGKGYKRLFLQGNIGAGYRTNNYSQFFKAGGEIGYKFIDELWTIFYLDYKVSFKNGSVRLPENNISTSLYVDDQEYTGYGLKAIYEFKDHFGLTAGFGGALSANAEARKAALNLGVFMKIKPKKK
jgi:hypothetical protein